MQLRNLWNLLRRKKKATNPAKITLPNIKAVIQAWIRQKRRSMGGFDIPDHMYEQIIWRRVQVALLSPKCWNEGSCKVCGCEILGKTMEDRSCEGTPACYPAMMKEDEWKLYKDNYNIKLFE